MQSMYQIISEIIFKELMIFQELCPTLMLVDVNLS